jgi:inhibitor of cysteine peptidase
LAATVTVTSSDDARSLDLHVGDRILVSLAENPTTGYRWELQAPNGRLALEDDTFEMVADPAVGRGGTRRFAFSAKAPGSVTIALRLTRAWARAEPPLQTFSVDVRVLP